MIKINFQISVDERLCKECNDAARQAIFVRGHFRVVNGRKVYVRGHYRKRKCVVLSEYDSGGIIRPEEGWQQGCCQPFLMLKRVQHDVEEKWVRVINLG